MVSAAEQQKASNFMRREWDVNALLAGVGLLAWERRFEFWAHWGPAPNTLSRPLAQRHSRDRSMNVAKYNLLVLHCQRRPAVVELQVDPIPPSASSPEELPANVLRSTSMLQ
jgi:hypothetical protein